MGRQLTVKRFQPLAAGLWLAVALGPVPATAEAAEAGETISVVLRKTQIDPEKVDLPKGSRLTFRNATEGLLKLTFRGKGDSAKDIQCARTEGSVPGPDLDALVNVQGDDLTIVVPPGPFSGACTFAAGDYTYDVRPEPAPETAESPSLGQVSAK